MKQKPQRSIVWNHESSLPFTRSRRPHWSPWSAARFIGAAVVAAALAGAYSPASGQGTQTADLNVSATVTRNCTIATDAINFGTYNALAGTAVDQQGAIKLTCTKGTVASITIGDGKTPQGGQRSMAGGVPAGYLAYELYSDATRTTRWGSAGQTPAIPSAPDNTQRSFPVYGRLPSNQNSVSQGTYADIVVATVNF